MLTDIAALRTTRDAPMRDVSVEIRRLLALR